ncbi:MAG: peptidylprolyl isomerase [Acidobacteriota bacterium]|nr:peptidylprolyl isomerase [Acidobacteriota bacterium]
MPEGLRRVAAVLAGLLLAASAGAQPPQRFTTPLTLAQMQHKQAVVETSLGTFVIDLRPDLAPNHVGYIMKLAEDGTLDGTIFQRVVRDGIIQGGDPLTKDPAKAGAYGTGGLNALKDEPTDTPQVRGTVSAVGIPGRADSTGSQFFICVADQPGLKGPFSTWGRVVEGMDVVQKISEVATDAQGHPTARVEIRKITIRDQPPPMPDPFATMSAADMAQYRAVLQTSLGAITIGFLPDKAPETVRNFLRLAQAGVFDGMRFHRVVKGFVIQTGDLSTRAAALTAEQQARVHRLAPEFSDIHHVKGVVSMAHGDDPGSATTSFFICTGDDSAALDGKYAAFGRVLDGMSVVDAINATPVDGEAPVTPVLLTSVRLERAPQ